MVLMDESLENLVTSGLINTDEAVNFAVDKKKMREKLLMMK